MLVRIPQTKRLRAHIGAHTSNLGPMYDEAWLQKACCQGRDGRQGFLWEVILGYVGDLASPQCVPMCPETKTPEPYIVGPLSKSPGMPLVQS